MRRRRLIARLRAVNYAYVDGSFEEETGRGAYGVVLLRPRRAAALLGGTLEELRDCNAAELQALRAALLSAPAGESLSVYVDNTEVLRALRRGSGPLAHEARAIWQLSAERELNVRLFRAPRSHRYMRRAHELAWAARTAQPAPLSGLYAECCLESAAGEIQVTLKRAGERYSVSRPASGALPPSVQRLLLAVSLARSGETLLLYRAGKLAAALWRDPRRALPGAAREGLRRARLDAHERGVTVLFEGRE